MPPRAWRKKIAKCKTGLTRELTLGILSYLVLNTPLLSFQARPSVERHVSAPGSSTSQQPPHSSMAFPWLPGLRNRQFQFVGNTNPETGVPSPEASTSQAYNQATGPVKPVSARVVRATNTSAGNSLIPYNPVTYSGRCYTKFSPGVKFDVEIIFPVGNPEEEKTGALRLKVDGKISRHLEEYLGNINSQTQSILSSYCMY